MTRFYSIIITLSLFATSVLAQNVGINNTGGAPNSSAGLDVDFTNKGVLIPRMTQAQRNLIASPATGLLIFQTDQTSGFYYYNGLGWTAIGDGSETKISAGTNVTISGSGTTASPYVVNAAGPTTLSIGQSYGGGIIFWLDASGQHGLIAATADQGTVVEWYSNSPLKTTNAVRDGIGAGMYNTERIIATLGVGNTAAQLCASYQGGGYGDWYLPSKYELNLLFLQRSAVGGFTADNYWCSNESNIQWKAWFVNFFFGDSYEEGKESDFRVRAIRAF